MENYESKYKEALSFLKDLKTHMSDYCREKLEEFFTELKESEDERIRKDIIDFLKEDKPFADNETLANWISWLEKQGEQKPIWSEEDEKALDDALWCCKQAASIAKDENDMGNAWYAENWLKSIKHQSHWKPSEEQMRVLQIAIRDYGICHEKHVLESLYNNLKNL